MLHGLREEGEAGQGIPFVAIGPRRDASDPLHRAPQHEGNDHALRREPDQDLRGVRVRHTRRVHSGIRRPQNHKGDEGPSKEKQTRGQGRGIIVQKTLKLRFSSSIGFNDSEYQILWNMLEIRA